MIAINSVSRRILRGLVGGPKPMSDLYAITGIDRQGLYTKRDGEWSGRGASGTWGTRVVDQELQRLRRAGYIRYADREWHAVDAVFCHNVSSVGAER